MSRRKSLTFKSPNMLNLAAVLVVILCLISPAMRYNVGSAFIWVGQSLQGEIQ